jgi:hypothetical protein
MNSEKTRKIIIIIFNILTTTVSLLTLCFILLRVANIITWSWFWILSPVFFGIGIYIIIYIIL